MKATAAICHPFPSVFDHVPRRGKIETLYLSDFVVVTCWVNDEYREIEAIDDVSGVEIELTDGEIIRVNAAVDDLIERYAQDCDSDSPFVIDGSEVEL